MQITAPAPSFSGVPNRVRDLAVFGDSRPAQNTNVSGTLIRKYAIGYAVWAETLSGRTLRFDETLNFGVAGDSTTQALARIGPMLASSASAVVIDIGINDIGGGVIPFATTIANYTSIVQQTVAAGKTALLLVMTPFHNLNGTSPPTATMTQQAQALNNFIRDLAAKTAGCILIDPTVELEDNTTGYPLGLSAGGSTAVTYDGLHEAPRGAFWVGKYIADALSPSPNAGRGGAMFPNRLRQVMQSPFDVYNATNLTTGSRVSASMMTGATGGTANAGVTGVVPNGFILGRGSGTVAAVTGSFISDTTALSGNPLNKYRMAVTAPSGSASDSIVLATAGTFAAGDVVYAACDVDISGITADSFRGLRLNVFNSGQAYYSATLEPRSPFALPNIPWSGTLRTPNLTVPTGTTSITANLEIFLIGTVASAAVTVDVSRFKLASVS